jgi:predicted deacylase
VTEGQASAFAAPDLEPYRAGNTGIPYVMSFAAERPGPHVMLMALTHGNEICGAVALDLLLREQVRPSRGRLTLGFANIAAYRHFAPTHPLHGRFVEEDFNRLWDEATLDGPRRSIELTRARELRPLIDEVDLLLDLHSMSEPSPPLMLAGLSGKSLALARRVGAPAIVMRDRGHAAGKRLRDYRKFADETAPDTALLVECGAHWQREAAATATEIARRFLVASGAVEGELAPAPPQRLLEVTHAMTVASGDFTLLRPLRGLETIAKAGTAIARDGGATIATPYDDCVIVMPSAQAARGETALRFGRFVAWQIAR